MCVSVRRDIYDPSYCGKRNFTIIWKYETMTDRLLELFAEELEVDAGELSDDSSPDSIASWDSLAAMRLVAAIEGEFGVRLSTREAMKMRTIGIARSVLREKNVDV